MKVPAETIFEIQIRNPDSLRRFRGKIHVEIEHRGNNWYTCSLLCCARIIQKLLLIVLCFCCLILLFSWLIIFILVAYYCLICFIAFQGGSFDAIENVNQFSFTGNCKLTASQLVEHKVSRLNGPLNNLKLNLKTKYKTLQQYVRTH